MEAGAGGGRGPCMRRVKGKAKKIEWKLWMVGGSCWSSVESCEKRNTVRIQKGNVMAALSVAARIHRRRQQGHTAQTAPAKWTIRMKTNRKMKYFHNVLSTCWIHIFLFALPLCVAAACSFAVQRDAECVIARAWNDTNMVNTLNDAKWMEWNQNNIIATLSGHYFLFRR